MPLVQITVPAGSIPADSLRTLRQEVAAAVMRAMGLPATTFFSAATWVYVQEVPEDRASTADPASRPGFLVVVTALEGFLTPERNEALSAEVTRHVLAAAARPPEDAGSVWTIVREVPEGFWSVGGALTRRNRLDALIASASAATADT